MANAQKSGSYGDGQTGPTRRPVASNAGAGRVKGGATMKQQINTAQGARPQKSGSKGG